MAESEAAKPDPRGESGNEVHSQHSNTMKRAQGADITEQHIGPDHTPGLSCAKEINFSLGSVTVLLGFLTLQAKQITLKSVELSG